MFNNLIFGEFIFLLNDLLKNNNNKIKHDTQFMIHFSKAVGLFYSNYLGHSQWMYHKQYHKMKFLASS